MILVIGGLGFIGSHTVRALVDRGEDCVVSQHVSNDVPEFIVNEVGRRLRIVPLDVTRRDAVMSLCDRYPIDGIVYLGGAYSSNPFEDMRDATTALANVLEAASAWKVKRLCIASAIGVYRAAADASDPLNEDTIVPLAGNRHPIVAQKKATEIYAELIGEYTGIECVALRIAGIYGPRYRGMRTFVSRLAHAAARKTSIDLDGVRYGAAPDDGGDWCYVKDCARAIALVQTASVLRHRIYNIGSGGAVRNRDFVAIVRRVFPDAGIPAAHESDGAPVLTSLDITRIRDDAGYTPRFDAEEGISDYIAWLQRGHSY